MANERAGARAGPARWGPASRALGPAAAVAWLAAALLAGGCWDRHEVETLGVAMAVAFDADPTGRELVMTAQFPIPSRIAGATGGAGTMGTVGPGSGPTAPFARTVGGPSGPTAWVVGVRAPSVIEARERMAALSPRLPFWAHVRVAVIGEALARRGLRPLLDALARDREFRLTPWIVVARGVPGYRLLELPSPLESLPANSLLRLLQSEQFRTAFAQPVRLREFLIDLMEPGVEPIAPALTFEKPVMHDPGLTPTRDPGLPALPTTAGTAVFRGDRLVGWLSADETRGLILLRGRSRQFSLGGPCPGGEGRAVVDMVRFTTRRRMESRPPPASDSPGAGGPALPRFAVEVAAEGNLGEQGCRPPLDARRLAELQRRMSAELERQMRETLQRLHQQMRADAVGFGKMVARGQPELWAKIRSRWADYLPELAVEVAAEVRVRRRGLTLGEVDPR